MKLIQEYGIFKIIVLLKKYIKFFYIYINKNIVYIYMTTYIFVFIIIIIMLILYVHLQKEIPKSNKSTSNKSTSIHPLKYKLDKNFNVIKHQKNVYKPLYNSLNNSYTSVPNYYKISTSTQPISTTSEFIPEFTPTPTPTSTPTPELLHTRAYLQYYEQLFKNENNMLSTWDNRINSGNDKTLLECASDCNDQLDCVAFSLNEQINPYSAYDTYTTFPETGSCHLYNDIGEPDGIETDMNIYTYKKIIPI